MIFYDEFFFDFNYKLLFYVEVEVMGSLGFLFDGEGVFFFYVDLFVNEDLEDDVDNIENGEIFLESRVDDESFRFFIFFDIEV